VSKKSRSLDPDLLDRVDLYREHQRRGRGSDADIIEQAIEEFLEREAERLPGEAPWMPKKNSL